MKTTINRYDVHVFERLVSKLVKSSDLPQNVTFSSHDTGLRIAMSTREASLSMLIPKCDTMESFTLPWSIIKEIATKKQDVVSFEVCGNNIDVSYTLGGVPQNRSFPLSGAAETHIPVKPHNTVAHPVTILDALCDAGKCVDHENTRYSLGSICLRGVTSQIISTDGRQALMQDGFEFPWSNDVLCPVVKIFNSKELHEQGDTVNIGFDNEQIYFELGNVAFWLNPIAGNFPHLDKLVKSYERFSWLNVHADDASFVTQRLDNLPGKEDHDTPIYVELNSYVSVRGCDAAQSNATELRLSRSHFEGKSVVMSMNRRFLKNALNFGIHRIGFDPDEQQPEIGFGERKTCIVMPLEGTPPNLDTAHITVLSSSDTPAPRQTMSKPKQEVPTSTQSEPVQKQKSKGQLLEEAEKLREALRESLVGVNGLIKEIKSQKRHDKLLRDTVASLRKLQDA